MEAKSAELASGALSARGVVRAVAARAGLTQADVRAVLAALNETAEEQLRAHGRFMVKGLCWMRIESRAARGVVWRHGDGPKRERALPARTFLRARPVARFGRLFKTAMPGGGANA